MAASPKRILLAGIAPTGEASLAFVASLLRMQVDLLRSSSVRVSFEFFDHLGAALEYFYKADPEFDVFVGVRTDMTVESSQWFVECDRDFVVGVYPTGIIDWKRVDEKIATTTSESPSCVGHTYNVDLSKSAINNGRYVVVKNAGLGLVKLRRTVVDSIEDKKRLFGPGAEYELCELWGKDIYADIATKTVHNCSVPFYGCVGQRRILR